MSKGRGKDKIPDLTMIAGENKVNETKEIIENLKLGLPYQIEYMKILATLTRAKYLALVEEGFTINQALELSKQLYSDDE